MAMSVNLSVGKVTTGFERAISCSAAIDPRTGEELAAPRAGKRGLRSRLRVFQGMRAESRSGDPRIHFVRAASIAVRAVFCLFCRK